MQCTGDILQTDGAHVGWYLLAKMAGLLKWHCSLQWGRFNYLGKPMSHTCTVMRFHLKLKLKKCELFHETIEYLGHQVYRDSIRRSPRGVLRGRSIVFMTGMLLPMDTSESLSWFPGIPPPFPWRIQPNCYPFNKVDQKRCTLVWTTMCTLALWLEYFCQCDRSGSLSWFHGIPPPFPWWIQPNCCPFNKVDQAGCTISIGNCVSACFW